MNAVVRLYRGPNNPAAIDWETPIAQAPAGATAVQLPALDWSASRLWFLAARTTDNAGADYAAIGAVARIEFDAAGRLYAPRPPAIRQLWVRAAANQRLSIQWRWPPIPGAQNATSFQIFIALTASTIEQLLQTTPAATLTADGAVLYNWRSEALPAGETFRVAVRAIAANNTAGPPAAAVAAVQPPQAIAIPLLACEVTP